MTLMTTHHSQRGAAALPITLILAFAVLLAVAFANRSVLLQVRTSVNQLHTAQAHEAAQAGLEWTLALLNRQTPVGESCLAAPASTAAPWHEAARHGPLHASCIARGEGWECHCPTSGVARAVHDAAAPAFRIELTPDAREPERWQLSATGHGNAAGRVVTLRLSLGRLPALDTMPAAALAVRGDAGFAGDFALFHTEPEGPGVTLHAGGRLQGTAPRAVSTPGTPASASLVTEDAALADLGAARLHASLFRMDAATWRAQPGVVVVDCHAACDASLADAARHHTTILLEGGLRLNTPLVVGSRERPVVLVVAGPVAIEAAATLHGLVYSRDAGWRDTAGATLHGALVAEGNFAAEGASAVHHDADVLRALQRRGGTYAPVAGTWRDL